MENILYVGIIEDVLSLIICYVIDQNNEYL